MGVHIFLTQFYPQGFCNQFFVEKIYTFIFHTSLLDQTIFHIRLLDQAIFLISLLDQTRREDLHQALSRRFIK